MLALNIQNLRIKHGWTQGHLADESGVSQTYISELEAGKKQPTLPIAKKLATALGVSVADLISEPKVEPRVVNQ